jgi:rhodanese-related sulfurtransferase
MFDFLFGNSKLKTALRQGGVIIDLRSPRRFDEGHIPDAINIPVDRIPINLSRLKGMNIPIILCGDTDDITHARHQLQGHGVKEVHSGGSWTRLLRIVHSL